MLGNTVVQELGLVPILVKDVVQDHIPVKDTAQDPILAKDMNQELVRKICIAQDPVLAVDIAQDPVPEISHGPVADQNHMINHCELGDIFYLHKVLIYGSKQVCWVVGYESHHHIKLHYPIYIIIVNIIGMHFELDQFTELFYSILL